MIRQFELVEKVSAYNPRTDEALLNRAYVYAMKAHGSQKRASGDPYITHPLEVANILAGLRLDDATIVGALLHDTIEDTDTTRAEIDTLFGHEIGALVEGLTKIKRLDLVSKEAARAENFRRLLLAVCEDVRVLLIKLADRLHNMRTLEHMSVEKSARIAQETMDIYAPLAGRMGVQGFREELEDLSFPYLSPDGHAMIMEKMRQKREQSGALIEDILSELSHLFEEADITTNISAREKRPYSIWRKMERKLISFEQLSDIFGFRLVVDNIDNCYRALGIVHTRWRTVPGRFKDHISIPKENDYRSIHTTVIGPRHQRVELQIRDRKMHEIAEFGIAAHVLYKEQSYGGKRRSLREHLADSNAYRWLRGLLERLEEGGDNPEKLLEHTKLELFHDQVFCFTPKGEVIALPRGATPIDFAYAVHTEVGDNCVGCKINGQIAPLTSQLSNGVAVEIICSKDQVPPAAWESIAVTGKARASIRRATKAAVRGQYQGLGRQILMGAFERAERNYSDEVVESILHRLARKDLADVLVAVGRGELSSDTILRAAYPDYQETARTRVHKQSNRREEGWFGLRRAIGLKFRIPGRGRPVLEKEAETGVPIRGHKGDLPVLFGPGGAVPGDRIVGIITPGSGITIYPIQSDRLREFEDQPERWLDVRWDIDPDHAERFMARIRIAVINEPGALAQIAQVIGDHDGNIDNISMTAKSHDFREMIIGLEVWDIQHLNSILSHLRQKRIISDVGRVVE